MKILYVALIQLLLLASINCTAQKKILFDNKKGEIAGNADWIIDADSYDLGANSSGVLYIGGFESNAQKIPTPAQSGITSTTAENYWTGGLSAWAIDMAREGFTIETLPWNGSITYGNSSNAQDLSNYKVYVVCEPNIRFTSTEKTAILNFVNNGGGLYMIAGHDGADRNFDGWDARQIWNDLMLNNSVQNNPFGIFFDSVDVSSTYSKINNVVADSIISGKAGTVTKIQYNGGATMTLEPLANNSVVADIRAQSSPNANTIVAHAHCTFGKGKVAAMGDSSPADDGTGDTGDVLYDGYYGGANGNHYKLLINATLWLARDTAAAIPVSIIDEQNVQCTFYPNPNNGVLHLQTNTQIDEVQVVTLTGQLKLIHSGAKATTASINLQQMENGVYVVRVKTSLGIVQKIIVRQ
jgi:hypothetical protein